MSASLLERLSGRSALAHEQARPLRFGEAAKELQAGLGAAMLVELCQLGRVRATGKDILDLLHRLSTADLRELAPGTGRPTVLTSSKGRILERIFVHHLGAAEVLLVTGEGGAARVSAHIDRFTFSEATGLADVSGTLRHLGLVGPEARQVAETAGLPLPPSFGSARFELDGRTLFVLGEDGFGGKGLSWVFSASDEEVVGARLVARLLEHGATLGGCEALEAWRILEGYPIAGHELSEEHNPLEAGLEDAISFSKGCYVGQEVVARLRTYDKVSRILVGLVFRAGAALPARGSALSTAGREAGIVRSAVVPPGRTAPVALAYVRRQAATPGTTLQVGGEAGETARVVRLPFELTP